ncbi:cupin domain-containing protein [Halobium palmae]|uniref:Cupin domain-containing protein n=1 Tax=Halobium palmae TaxID=1776492 RepID=A0ABD5RVC9_9EURY
MSDELIAVHSEDRSEDTAQTDGLPRLAGIGPNATGTDDLWMGRVTGEPGEDSAPHHHGEAETGGYILSGNTRIFYGENYDECVDLEPGDFVYVPPFTPHVERNLNEDQPVEFVTVRTPANITENLTVDPDLPPR